VASQDFRIGSAGPQDPKPREESTPGARSTKQTLDPKASEYHLHKTS
jgi:hypothetical protein